MHQVLLIISPITHVSAIAQLYLFFFTVSITYQNLLILSLQYSYQVRFFYQLPILKTGLRSHYISNSSKVTSIRTPYQLSSSPIICLHEVIVLCTCVKSPITFWCQLTDICFLYKKLLSDIPITYSSVTTKFSTPSRYPIGYSYQLLLSPYYTVAAQTTPCRYFFSHFYQLLLSTPISYSCQLLIISNLLQLGKSTIHKKGF